MPGRHQRTGGPDAAAEQQHTQLLDGASSPGDHFVPGKYDKTGSYIPPHYAPVAKPAFHGYFYKQNQPGYDGMDTSTTNKNRLGKTDQAGSSTPN